MIGSTVTLGNKQAFGLVQKGPNQYCIVNPQDGRSLQMVGDQLTTSVNCITYFTLT